ncbi:NAD(P)/FAD-dependent oxidoreductase [Humitalea sp. 24SJ18S-53]|uniref:NAD(P)/FAD-dependent oxidoreductase n=1 Tax=Humitalea sp. 24SJ18S-53 TaxID=3422307 RepID=UPI003D66DEDA
MVDGIELVSSDKELPAKVDVVVIGGGIMGASTAFELVQRGLTVALCEKGVIAGEQSGRNWGWVRKMGRDPREMPLMIRAMRIWAGLNEATEAETGFRVTGITYFADTDADIARYTAWMEAVAKFQIDSRAISAAEAMALAPGSTKQFVGGMHTASDGMAEPTLATVAIAKAARKRGAKIYTNTAVRSLDMTNGRVSGVFTERGRIACTSVVLAGGGWSGLFMRNLGLRLPQLKLLSQVMRTAPIEAGLQGCGSGRGFGFRKRLDGGYNMSMRAAHPVDIVPDSFRYMKDFQQALGNERKSLHLRIGRRSIEELFMRTSWKPDQKTPFERYRTYSPTPGKKVLDAARRSIDGIFPALAKAQVVERIGGLIDVTPDAIPVISAVPEKPGFFLSCGYSGHGFGIGPGAGQLMAELVTGETPCVDPTPFRFSRFSDGSKIEHWPIGL